MSQYFTRLAARTGLHAPQSSGAPAADIAEQSVEIEAAHPAPVLARSAAPPKSSAAPADSTPAANKTGGEAVTHDQYPVAAPPTQGEKIYGEPPSRQQPQARAPASAAPDAPPLFDRAVSSFAAEEAVRGNNPDASGEVRRAGPPPARHEESAARIAPRISPTPVETVEGPPPPRAPAQTIPPRAAPPAEKLFEPARAPRAAGENSSAAPARAENSAPSARAQSTPPPAPNEVEVHIGAIKLEIHPPPPAAPPPAPRPENIPERRFEPRRHYLRW